MASRIRIPQTPEEWLVAAQETYPDVADFNISGTAQEFGSASKLSYEDWLLLKILWPLDEGRPTHNTFFGSRGSDLRTKAEKHLSQEPWMEALTEWSDNPKKWSYMAPWKLSVDDILLRKSTVLNLTPSKIYDESDPFQAMTEPSDVRTRPRREVQRQAYYTKNTSDSDRSSNRSPKHGPSSLESQHSPSRSDEMAVSSASPGSGRGGAVTSSPESGKSDEDRMINKHRPDEALINMSIVLLLQGVCMSLFQESIYKSYGWSILHKQFSVTQPDRDDRLKRTKILTAKTDGCLQFRRHGEDPDKGDTLAIIEVKPYRRSKPYANTAAIRIQEGAEMAAWISTDVKTGFLPSSSQKKTYRRLLISQDFDQIFITVAEFDDAYIKYIRGDSIRWSIASRNAPQTSPSRDPQSNTATNQRSNAFPSSSMSPWLSSSSEEEEQSGPRTSKDKKSIFVATFRPSVKTSSTPRAQATRSELPPAPKQAAAVDRSSEGAFLRMHEYKPFTISDRDQMRELALLLYSLTENLCHRDSRLRLQLNQS